MIFRNVRDVYNITEWRNVMSQKNEFLSQFSVNEISTLLVQVMVKDRCSYAWLIITAQRHADDRNYSTAHFKANQQMDLGAPAALPPGNDYPIPIEYEDEWTSESVWVPMEKKTSHLSSPEWKPQLRNRPSCSPVTMLIELSCTGLTEMRYAFKVLPKFVKY